MATAPVGSLLSTQSERIEEVINKNVDVILPGLDPVWMDTIVTSQGVGSSDAMGRDFNILRVFQGGLTGVLEQANPRDDFPLFGDSTDSPQNQGDRIYTQQLENVFPDPTAGANQKPYRLGIPMRAMVSNIMFTLGELTAEAKPAFIGQVIAPKLEGFARNIGHQMCNYWYISQNTFYKLSGMAGVSIAAGTPNYVTFSTDNEACDRYFPGQLVDIYAANGSTKRNGTSLVFVDYVDELTNSVRLVSSQYDFTGVVNTDIIVYRNSNTTGSTYTGIAGINSWLKDGTDGTNSDPPVAGTGNELVLLGDESVAGDTIDVSIFPEHKSMGYSLGGSVLTEHTLRQLLRRFHAAKNKYGYYIDCLIASDGVWLAHEGSKIGRERVDRSSRLGGTSPQGYSSSENFGGFSFTMDGRSYMGYTSTYIEDGVMYGIRKGGNNWKRYVPPDFRNLKPFDRNSPFIPFRFVAGALTGLGTNQLPIYSTLGTQASGTGSTVTTVTEGVQMPGWLRMQLVPDQFSMMKLTNCATDKIYADF